MKHSSKASRILIWALIALAAAILVMLPVFASSGDYGVNTGGGAETQQAPTQPPPTNTPIPPTATPSGPTPTPTCTDGQWGQESNGAWVCIPNSELTPGYGGG